MALEGTLRDFSLADIFQLIGIQKKTGVLTLRGKSEVVSVSFLNGDVVSADSSMKNLEDRLGTVLVRSGRISEARLQQALRVQKETLQRLGYILVTDRYISDADLKEALRLQVTQIVYRLFRWADGDYHFSQTDSVEYDRDHFSPLSAENILMEGIRMIDEWPIIERKIRSFEMVFRKARPGVRLLVRSSEAPESSDLDAALNPDGPQDGGPAQEDVVKIEAEEASIYGLVDGSRTVQDLIDRGRLGEFETCRILYELLSRGLISTAREAETPASPSARRPPRLSLWTERLGYVALALFVGLSLYTIPNSPLSGMPDHLAPAGAVERVKDLVTRNRMTRIDEAIQVYYLQKGFFPDDLRELVKGRLVPQTSLSDTRGRSFGFIATTGGYSIIAYEEGGAEIADLTISRRLMPLPMVEPPEPGEPAARLSAPTASGASR